jgi:hypothetical protein
VRFLRVGLLAALLGALALPVVRSGAQEAPADPANDVLAIVSPVVAPACALSGSATLLVPIVSGVITPSLPTGVPSVADVLLNTIGPVFVVCGELPAAPGTRCQLDDQISGMVPAEISSLTGPTPGVVGNTLDSLDALFKALQLPPAAALDEALVCTINDGPGITEAPPGESEPVAAPPVDDSSLTSVIPSLGGSFVAAPAVAGPTASAPAQGAPSQLIATVERSVPGGLKALQIAAAALLAVVLLGGWAGSWLDARRARGAS